MKPKGWAKFDLLARKLVNVPKEIVNEKIDKEKAARKKAKEFLLCNHKIESKGLF